MIRVLLLLMACHPDSETDTSQQMDDTGSAVDDCSGEAPYSEAVMGTVLCEDSLCEVPSGSFWMGVPNPGATDQCPPRRVELSGFFIDRTEVRVADYIQCVSAGECEAVPEHCETAASVSNPEEAPITCVRHDQAEAYCAWAGGRLPTEAEWEKSARGEEGAPWAWGRTPPTCTTANFREITTYCELGVLEVGSYPESQSAFGLLDTVGNAWEWVSDHYDAGYYRDAPDIDPIGPELCSLEVGGERGECSHRVMRGGAFNARQDASRGAARAFGPADLWDVNIGFRCAFSSD